VALLADPQNVTAVMLAGAVVKDLEGRLTSGA
jgi:hypothetical protein